MKQRIRILGSLVLVLALVLSISLAVSTSQAVDVGEAVDASAGKAVEALLSQSQAAQAGWAVWQNGRIISSGSRTAQNTPGTGDAYNIGSISKVFTTAAVMQLAEKGKLDLDQPVVKYLPAFTMADARYKDITIRMLLNHSSGLMGSSFSSGLLFDDPTPVDLLERLSTQRLKADPGAFSVYCNDGFSLAELVIEAVTGMDFIDCLRANLFAPAGLEDIWAPKEDFESRRVEIRQDGAEDPLPKECMNVLGAAGLYGTPEAVAAFGGALTTAGTLLKKASLDAMAAPEYSRGIWPEEDYPNIMTFGLGWDNVAVYPFAQNGITALAKGGDTTYYHAGLVVIPEYHLSAAILSAGGASVYNEMAAAQMLLAALREQGKEAAELRLRLPNAQPADMPKDLLDAAGFYGGREVYQIKISEDGALSMGFPAKPALPERTYSYYSDGTFRSQSGTSALRIVKERNGQTYLYQWNGSSFPVLGWQYDSSYTAMKLPENKVSPELQASWNAVMDREFLPMNERYSSQAYLSLGMLLQVAPESAASAPGYIQCLKIEDQTHLRFVPQVPGNAGRDGIDVEARRDAKGALWLFQSNGAVYMDKNAVSALSIGSGGSAACTIQPDGYARWYKIGENAAGKQMTVQAPENAGFWVYDSRGTVTASSAAWNNASATLPQDGMIVFAGDPGAKFQLAFS